MKILKVIRQSVLSLLMLVAVGAVMSQSKIYYVSPTGSGTKDGLSWSNTMSLESALTAAKAGDQVWVQGFEHITDNTQLYITSDVNGFTVKSGVQLYGGFSGKENNINERETLGKAYQMKYRSLLSGDINKNDAVDNISLIFPANQTRLDNATHVLSLNMNPESGGNNNNYPTVVNGFSIGGGQADGKNECGGGIYIYGDNKSAGGIFRIERCFLVNNYATQGGAVYVEDAVENVNKGESLINQCVVFNNAAGERAYVFNAGGGIYAAGAVTIVNSSIFNNENGGLRLSKESKVVNSTIARNSGAGIDLLVAADSDFNVFNTIIWGNTLLSAQYQPKFKNSAFHEVSLGDDNGNIYVTKENRGDKDAPMFDAPSIKTSYDRDFNWRQTSYPLWSWNVLEGSVMQGKGMQEFYDQTIYGSEDMAGNVRIHGTTIDIGAYEFQQMPTGRVRYVMSQAQGTGDGSSWENASGDLQKMIDELAFNNPQNLPGEVWVAKGIYEPKMQIISGATYSASFLMRDGISVYGGFEGKEGRKQDRQMKTEGMPWEFVHKTILEGTRYEASKTVWDESAHKWIVTSDSRHVVFFAPLPSEGKSGFERTTTLNGVIVRGGYAQGNSGINEFLTDRGAGLYMGINAILEKCIVTENSATGHGGGVYLYGGRVLNTLIYNNNANGNGGAVFVDNAGIILSSMLTNNSADNGSGTYLAHTGNWTDGKMHPEYLILSTSIISNNTSRRNGAVYCDQGGVLLQNIITNNDCPTATDNTSGNASQTGGLYVNAYSLVVNSVIWNNTIQRLNVPIYAKNPTSAKVRFLYTALSGTNNTVWNNILQQGIISLAESNDLVEEGVLSPGFIPSGLPDISGVNGAWKGMDASTLYLWKPVTGSNLRARGMTLGTLPDEVIVAPEIDITGKRFAQKPAVGAYAVDVTSIKYEETADALKVYVDAECAVAEHDGSSWEYGYRSLNEVIAYMAGLDAKTVGSKRLEIHVLEGDIWPRYAFTNMDPKTATVNIPATVSGKTIYIYGGYHRNSDGNNIMRNPLTYRSVINGNHEGKDIEEGLYHCITVSRGAKVCLDGFHIINGYAAGEATRQYGAGLLVHDGAEVTVSNCIFENHTAQEGAAIDARNAKLTMNNCVVNNNTNTDNTKNIINAKTLTMNHVTVVNNVGVAPETSGKNSFAVGNTGGNSHTFTVDLTNFINPTKNVGANLGYDTYLGGYTSFMPTNQCEVVNKGTVTSGLTTDITGGSRSRGGAPDLGAYEAELPVDGTVVYVRQGGTGDGSTWEKATGSIQGAIDMATKEVWVAAGTYNERITLKNGVNLLGGFAKTGNPDNKLDGTNRDISNANPDFMTIIDGQSGGRVVTQSTDFATLTMVEGFVIQNGSIRGSDANNNGAGVKLMSNGKLKNCLVQNNTHTNTYNSWRDDPKYIGGGGISISAGSIVDGCIIKGNKANKENNDRYTCGAGIHMNGGTLINSIVVDNVATSTSGSGWLDWGSNILGAAVFIQNAGTFYNCTFAYNYANTNGKAAVVGGVWDDSKNSKFYNCIFWGNAGNGTGGENTIQVGGPGYSDGGTEAAANKNLINCYASIAESSQTTAELWVNPDATFQMNIGSSDYNQMISKARANQPFDDNYKLIKNTRGLHCINKGNNLYVEQNSIYLDAAGAARIQYCTVDKGAYESTDAITIEPDDKGVFYVTQNGAGTSDGSSVANASCAMELQRVLNAAGERVKSGLSAIVKVAGYESASFVYHANTLSNPNDPQSYTYVIPYGVVVMGGYSDKDPDWDNDNDGFRREPIKYKTVLSAINNSAVLEQEVNGYHTVTFGEKPDNWKGEEKKTIIDGLYLIDGSATSMVGADNPNTRGGGTIVPAWGHVRNCVVARCEAVQGGGLYVMPGGTVSGSLIAENEAEEGAGLYADNIGVDNSNRAHMVSCTVTDNVSSSIGGGLFLKDGAMMVSNSVIWGNIAPSDKNISGVLTETLKDDVWQNVATIASGMTDFYPMNHSFVETYEMPSNFENTSMESNEDLYFASSSRMLKAYSPLIKHGMETEHQQKMTELLDISAVDLQGIPRIQMSMPRVDAGAFAYNGGTIPTDVLLTRIFVSEGGNVQLPENVDLNKYIGRSFYTSLTWLDDALEYIKAVRKNGVAPEDTQFEILLASGTYKPNYRRVDASTTIIDQRQNSYVIPQGVSIYGGFSGDENYSSGEVTTVPGVDGIEFVNMGDINTILSLRAYSDFNQNGIHEPWELANQAILSGKVNVSEQVRNVYHVLYSDAGEKSTINPVVLDGITVMDGETSNELSEVSGMDEVGRGGGIYSNGVSYVLNRCQLINNFAMRGGAIYIRDAKLTIINSYLAGNGTVDNPITVGQQTPIGGAVYIAGISESKTYAALYTVNTLWVNNETVGYGGAIGTNYADGVETHYDPAISIMNNTFVRNKAEENAVIYHHNVNNTIVNTLMWGNESKRDDLNTDEENLKIHNSASDKHDLKTKGKGNILLSIDNMDVNGPRFTKPSTVAGVAGNGVNNLWNPVAISVLTDAGDGKDPISGDINGAYFDWMTANADSYATQYMGYKDYLTDYLRYAGPLDDYGKEMDKYIDIGLYEYQYELAFPNMDAIYVATVESGRGDGTNWANATSDLRGALMAMANPTGSQATVPIKDKTVYIKAGEYSLLRNSAGTTFTVSMGDSEHGTSLTVKGSYNESGVQDFSQPTIITTQESNADQTNILMAVAANNKPVSMEGLTFINKNATEDGGIGMQASSTGGKLTLKQVAFRGNKKFGLEITSGTEGKFLFVNTLFADGGTGLEGADNRTTVVNATFANNQTDYTTKADETAAIYNSVAWSNKKQNLIDYANNNVSIAGTVLNDNVNEGPNFRDPDTDIYNRDYRIRPSVKLLNKGSKENYTEQVGIEPANDKDLGNNARLVDNYIDVGAYEYEAPLQPIIYVKPDLTGTADGQSWETALGDLQGAVDLAGLYALNNTGKHGYVFVHGRYHDNTGKLNLTLGNTKVYGSMNDEKSTETETEKIVSDLLSKRKGVLEAINCSSLGTVTIGADGVIDGFEVTGAATINNGVLSTSVVKNDVGGEAAGLLYNSLVLGDGTAEHPGNVSGVTTVNVTVTGTITGADDGGNNRQNVTEEQKNTYVTDEYWNYQLMETSEDIDPTGDRTDISTYMTKVGHSRDLIGNARIRNTVDNGCFETWNISNDYTITADDYPVGKSVVYVRSAKELGIEKTSDGTLVYKDAASAFNPGFLLLEHQAGLRGNGNHIRLTNFAVERSLSAKGNDMAIMPFNIIDYSPVEGYNLKRYSGEKRAAYNYRYDGENSTAWISENFTQIGTTEGFLIENTLDNEITVRFRGNSYSESGEEKIVNLTKWNYSEPWDSNTESSNKFTHKENMSWNLFGSPYLCAMNYSNMEYGRVIYGLNGNSYETINTANETSGYIPAGDAVFTQTATLKDYETFSVAQSSEKSGTAYAASANLKVQLQSMRPTKSGEESPGDEILLDTTSPENSSTTFDLASDGVKWMSMNEDVPQIYMQRSGGRYSLLSAVNEEGEVEVGVRVGSAGTYLISLADGLDLSSYQSVLLTDLHAGKMVDLMKENYPFEATRGGDMEGRFRLSFNRNISEVELNVRLYSPSSGTVVVEGLPENSRVHWFQPDGRRVEVRDAFNWKETFYMQPGIYMMEVYDIGEKNRIGSYKIRVK